MSIYFDNSATTPVDPAVYQAMIPYLTEKFANPSSIHVLGRAVRDDIEKARATVAKTIGAEADEIIFTGSGSEADNLALIGAARALASKGKHIITSRVEHKAILQTCKFLEKEGFETTYIPVGHDGIVSADAVKKAIRPDTILVSVMMANNEVGAIMPIKEIAAAVRAAGAIMHTDAVQALGKLPIDVNELGVHMLTLSGHKIYAPKGIGALYVDLEFKDSLTPVIFGGSQEYGLRAGTENVPNIMALAKACELVQAHLPEEMKKMKHLRDLFENRVLSEIPDTYVNGTRDQRICTLTNLTFKYIEAEALMIYASDICCSTGSACTSESVEASHVLYAMGIDPVDAHGALRFSLGRFNTEEEVNRAVDQLKNAADKLRAMSPLYNQKMNA